MTEIYLNAIKSIFANKGRAVLTFFSIAVGVCAVVITINISSVGRSAIKSEIDGLGISGLAISTDDKDVSLSAKELGRIRSYSYVDNAVPLVYESADAYIRSEKQPVCLWGIDSNADKAISLKVKEGRFFNSGDIASAAKICMIDEKFSKEHYVPLGKSIIIKNGNVTDKYLITGIVKTGSGLLQNVMGSFIPDFIYLPYSTMQNNMGSDNFSQIIVQIDEGYDNNAYEKKLIRSMEKNSGKHNVYNVNDLSGQKENLDQILVILTIILSAIGAVSLIVAGINTMNIMLVAVRERTREIGIKKALGASRFAIVSEFLLMSAVISVIGSILGIVMGELITIAGSVYFGLTPEFNIGIIMIITGFTVVSGTIFGIYPAVKASRLEPAEAFRFI